MKLSAWEWAAVALGAIVSGAALLLATRLSSGNNVDDEADDTNTPGGPDQLAAAAGVSLAQYCLARAIVSEAGGESRLAQTAIGCACFNFALAEYGQLGADQAVVRLVLGTAGEFGRQGSGGRRVASTKEPAKLQLGLAGDVLAGRAGDPTAGATQWDSPRTQRWLLANGDPLTTKTPEQVAESRLSHGFELVVVAGVDPDVIRFWRLT